jgi:hypothetical protein
MEDGVLNNAGEDPVLQDQALQNLGAEPMQPADQLVVDAVIQGDIDVLGNHLVGDQNDEAAGDPDGLISEPEEEEPSSENHGGDGLNEEGINLEFQQPEARSDSHQAEVGLPIGSYSFPDFLPALDQGSSMNVPPSGPSTQNFNVNINMALTNVVLSNGSKAGWSSFSGGRLKPHPDVYRLWAKFFSPVGFPSHVVQIPTDWASFFTVMLLSPNHFDWAKKFLSSQAWKCMLQCAPASAMMSFALPSSCPDNGEVKCDVALDADGSSSHHDSNNEELPEKIPTRGKSNVPTVET